MAPNAVGQVAGDHERGITTEPGSERRDPLLEGLRHALKKVDRPGSFCVSGDVRLTHPGLFVKKGVGHVGLPLSAAQARELKELCEKAPYGKGEETIVDEAVRRVWRLSPSEFSLTNPDWDEALGAIVGRVEKALGLEKQGLECHLYDLLLYEPGGFFLPHRDGERLERMVATLVITLPSVFKGGELVVRHDGDERTIDFKGRSNPSIRLHYAAFYADCEHEIRPLREGYRLSLIYNLTLSKGGKKITAPREAPHVAAIREILQRWSQEEPRGKLVVSLDHQYTEAGLTWDTLKGADRAKADVLSRAAQEAGCRAYLSLVTLWESGSAEYADEGRSYYGRRRRGGGGGEGEDQSEYEMIDVVDWSLSAEHMVDQEGRVLLIEKLDVDEDDLLEPEALRKVKAEEEFEGYTGNEGMTLERWYRHAAILIWPERAHFDVLCKGHARPVVPLLTEMVDRWQRASKGEAEAHKGTCVELASSILTHWSGSSLEDSDEKGSGAPHLLKALVRLGERGLIERYLAEVLAKDSGANPGRAIVDACEEHGWRTFQGQLEVICQSPMRRALERNVRMLEEICEARPKKGKSEGHADLCHALAGEVVTALPALDRGEGSRDFYERDVDRGRLLAGLVRALIAGDQADLLERVFSHVLAHPQKYPLVGAHLRALEEVAPWLQSNLAASCPGVMRWIASCREELEALTAKEPKEPADFRRAAAVRCKCESCQELNRFLADRGEETHSFRAAQQVRSHLEYGIKDHACDLACRTERRGSPHTLVVTKTKASFHRALKKYHEDLERLAKVRSIEASLSG